MGAEVIIAVGLPTPDSANVNDDLLAVVKRSNGLMVGANEKANLRSLGQGDLILLPDLTAFSCGSYDQGEALAGRGYQEAQRKARFLETLSIDQGEWDSCSRRAESPPLAGVD